MSPSTPLARWDYSNVEPFSYGNSPMYERGMAELDDCATVQDWGCGTAWAKRFCKGNYVGVDETPGFADIVADLRSYTTRVEGIFMRGVLEHNLDWHLILDNAVTSFTKRFVLILFTPMQDQTNVLFWPKPDIPDVAFAASDIESRFGSRSFRFEEERTDTQYNFERMYVVESS